MGSTLAEKILARAAGREIVRPGEYVMARIDLAMAHDSLGPVDEILTRAGVERLWDSDKVVCLLDHWNPPSTVRDAEVHKRVRSAVKKFHIKHFYGQNSGICHQVLFEKGHVLPGRLIVGADSHTLTYGAFGAAAAGIGHSEMAYVLATGRLWFKVPETIKFKIRGLLPPRVTSKDIILFIAGKYSVDVAQYRSVEFDGETCKEMSLASRMTMSNMSAEIGAKFAFFEPDEQVERYLGGRTEEPFLFIRADEDASYEKVYEEAVSDLEPQIAFPFSVDNVKPISSIGSVKIDQAVLGSCTNGRIEDLKMAVEVMGGRKVHPDVRMLVIPASYEIYQEAIREGIISRLIESGAILCNPGCGPCMGAHMGLLASGEACIASTNRNFRGRMGSPDSELYLASPATVAASAVAGRIADPRDM
jgi:homoaconitate hydratase family protein